MRLDPFLTLLVRLFGQFLARYVRQTGAMPNMEHLFDELFLSFADELHRIGVPRRVASELFEIAPRSYTKRIQLYRDRCIERWHQHNPLWLRIEELLAAQGRIEREALLASFSSTYHNTIVTLLRYMTKQGKLQELRLRRQLFYQLAQPHSLTKQHTQQLHIMTPFVASALVLVGGQTREDQVADVIGLGIPQTLLDECLERAISLGLLAKTKRDGHTFYVAQDIEIQRDDQLASIVSPMMHCMALFESLLSRDLARAQPDVHNAQIRQCMTISFSVTPGSPLEEQLHKVHRSTVEGLAALLKQWFTQQQNQNTLDDSKYYWRLYFGSGQAWESEL